MTDRAWNEMLDEFRALGGTADNVCLREGAFGRGIFPHDPSRPVAIHIPENLLVSAADCAFTQGQFRVREGTGVGRREAMFLEGYENRFSWGGGGRAEVERVIAQAQELPAELRQTLKRDYDCGDWFDEATETLAQERYVKTRCVEYGGRSVVMPIVALLNHSPEGRHYESKGGICLEGRFDGEVLGRYSDADPLGIFANWGFASEQPQAFSAALTHRRERGAVRIGRDLSGLSPLERFWTPRTAKNGGIAFQFLMIGNRTHPRRCRGIFYRLMREAGAPDCEEAFDVVYHANLVRVESLLAALETARGPMADTLRKVARLQLKAISYCFGSAS